MTTAWEKFEEIIKNEMRKVYSETVIEHSMNPRNLGSMDDFNGFSNVTGSCGDTMQVWLKINGETISDASFTTDGCGTTIASGSMITELAKGKSIKDARKINQKEVLNALGGLPEESEHCALLAEYALKDALDDYKDRESQ